ncbi:hypothetical protein M4V62_17415 [Streptomyces durmitorensis]|uniref:Uncharacterized protein n=1 Tax=Streptomyces durmitorensis TaxID=319947 RepID=A0ABY4PU51_9ACTN|nr:hypothetical protein [Streptomyces durmitorensis]UQT56734.1 hypothetical protein M4V62_17415 [Streptomyces durmitorensis]
MNERVDAVLGEAVRSGAVDADAQSRAVAAFRSARDGGNHRARTRRRDDWRPSARGRALGSLRAAVGAVIASVLLGGVALASINASPTPDTSAPDRDRPSPPRTTAPAQRPASPTPPQAEQPGKAKDASKGKGKDKGKSKAPKESHNKHSKEPKNAKPPKPPKQPKPHTG